MIVIPPVQSYGSPTALELGQRLANVIAEYRASRPGTTADDVRQALRIAGQASGGGAERRRVVLVVALIAGLVAMLLPILLRPAAARPGAGPWVPMVLIVLIASIFVAIRATRR